MTTPDPFADPYTAAPPGRPPASRRARRHRREIRRRVLGGALGAFLLLALGLFVTDTVRLPGGSRPVLASGGATRDPGKAPEAPDAIETRPLGVTTPLRLWIAGDSLAYALGQTLGNATATTGVVKPVYDARVSSGLSSPSFFDWPNHARKETARLDPEAVVFIIGANDVGVVGGKDWRTTYGAEIDEMMDLLAGPDDTRIVYWVGPPTFRDKTSNDASRQMNDLMRERATKHPTVVFIDGYDAFADSKGKYATKLPDEDDTLVLVRSDDGVHFTAEGGERLARIVFAAMDRAWRLQAQAVEGAIQTIEQTDGCCRAPGGSNNTQWQTGKTPTRAPASTTKPPSSTAAPTSTTTVRSAPEPETETEPTPSTSVGATG